MPVYRFRGSPGDTLQLPGDKRVYQVDETVTMTEEAVASLELSGLRFELVKEEKGK